MGLHKTVYSPYVWVGGSHTSVRPSSARLREKSDGWAPPPGFLIQQLGPKNVHLQEQPGAVGHPFREALVKGKPHYAFTARVVADGPGAAAPQEAGAHHPVPCGLPQPRQRLSRTPTPLFVWRVTAASAGPSPSSTRSQLQRQMQK